MLKDTKRAKDGSVTVTVRRLTRRIRALDGSYRTLVSLDGQTWVWDQREAKEARRLQAAINLNDHRRVWVKDPVTEKRKLVRVMDEDPHTGKQTTWSKLKIKDFDARVNPGVRDDASHGRPADSPVILPVVQHRGRMLGKAKGKAQKYRRNLRRKKERIPKVAKMVHFHNCPGEGHPHWRRRFSCSCERPAARHVVCGMSRCLYDSK